MTSFTLPSPPKIKATNFALMRLQAVNPMRGGGHQAVDVGEPLWRCDIETTPLSRAQGGVWKWLLAKTRGALRTLFLYDASRPRPLAYIDSDDSNERIGIARRIGAGKRIGCPARAWGAAVRVTAFDRTNSRIKLEGLLPGATISQGDYGALDDGPARRFFICGDAVADNIGTAWVDVEPQPPSSEANLPAGFEMHCASAEMMVMQADAPYSAPIVHQVTLSAGQVIRRS